MVGLGVSQAQALTVEESAFIHQTIVVQTDEPAVPLTSTATVDGITVEATWAIDATGKRLPTR